MHPMSVIRKLIVACVGAVLWLTANSTIAGETLLVHGHIFTGNSRAPWAVAVAIVDTHIAAIGSDTEILQRRRSHTHVLHSACGDDVNSYLNRGASLTRSVGVLP